MKGTTSGIGIHSLVAELGILGLVAHKGSGDHHFLTSDKDDLLTRKELLRDNGTEPTMKVVTAVDQDGFFEDHFKF